MSKLKIRGSFWSRKTAKPRLQDRPNMPPTFTKQVMVYNHKGQMIPLTIDPVMTALYRLRPRLSANETPRQRVEAVQKTYAEIMEAFANCSSLPCPNSPENKTPLTPVKPKTGDFQGGAGD